MPRKCKKCIEEQRKEMFFPVNDMFYFKTLQHEMVLILIFCCYFIVFKFKISTFNFKTITIMAELLDLEKKRPRDTSGDVMTLTTNEKQKKLIHQIQHVLMGTLAVLCTTTVRLPEREQLIKMNRNIKTRLGRAVRRAFA